MIKSQKLDINIKIYIYTNNHPLLTTPKRRKSAQMQGSYKPHNINFKASEWCNKKETRKLNARLYFHKRVCETFAVSALSVPLSRLKLLRFESNPNPPPSDDQTSLQRLCIFGSQRQLKERHQRNSQVGQQ